MSTGDTLVFSKVGFVTKEFAVGIGDSNMVVELAYKDHDSSYIIDPGIKLERYSFKISDTDVGVIRGSDSALNLTPVNDFRWILNCVTEEMTGYNPQILPGNENNPIWVHPTPWPKDTAGYRTVTLGVDGYNHPNVLDTFGHPMVGRIIFSGVSYGWWDDPQSLYKPPSVDKDVFVDFRMKLAETPLANYSTQHYYKNGVDQGPITYAMLRATFGILTYWDGKPHFLEIHLWRTNNYDWVSTTWNNDNCPRYDIADGDAGIYDRLSCFGSGECIYINGKNANYFCQPVVKQLTGAMQKYSINVSALIRSIPWSYPHTIAWNQIKLAGIYLGVETFGEARCVISFDQLDVWTK